MRNKTIELDEFINCIMDYFAEQENNLETPYITMVSKEELKEVEYAELVPY